jgi:hypothetical protein
MTDELRDEEYEAPEVEDLDATEGPTVTSAGASGTS